MNYIYTDEPIEQAANQLAKTLIGHLSKGERVLWLLSGGSSIPIAIMASKKLSGIDLSNLFVSLTDERFGPVGHKDENWQQLLDDGLSLPGANLYRPLIGRNVTDTTATFNNWLDEQLDNADFRIGIFGLGTDGHTAGIKPYSKAVSTKKAAVWFKGDDFERVTISFTVICRIDEAIIQASGSEKRAVIHELVYDDLPLTEQPAQILKTIPQSTIYSNIKEEEIK